MCDNCIKKLLCKRPCEQIEDELNSLGHSIKSNYLVKFVDPNVLEEVSGFTESDILEPRLLEIILKKQKRQFRRRLKKLKKLYKCLRKLKPVEKQCVIYYYGLKDNELLSQEEIATILNVSQNTISYHLRNAREKLKILLPRRGISSSGI